MRQEDLKELDLQPQQLEFIRKASGLKDGGRVVLSYPVGLGSRRAAVGLIATLSGEREHRLRTLIVAPTALLQSWMHALASCANVDALLVDSQELRRLEAKTQANQNPWTAAETVVTSVDFAKSDARSGTLVAADWDVVIFDQAHLASGASQQFALLRALWESERVPLLVAIPATMPTELVEELGPPPSSFAVIAISYDRDDQSTIGSANTLDVLEIEFSTEERELLTTVEAMLDVPDRGDPLVDFQARLILRRASSSIFALEQTLSRALSRGPDLTPSTQLEAALSELSEVGVSEELDAVFLELDSTDEVEPRRIVGDKSVVSTPLSQAQLRELLSLIEDVASDSKWSLCEYVLDQCKDEMHGPTAIFTDFADTAAYIGNQLSSADPGRPVLVATGSTPLDERKLAIEMVRNRGGVLVLTSAASAGADLSFVTRCVHYDTPPSPVALEQRLGRVNRIGRTSPVRHIAFADGITDFEASVRQRFGQ